MKMEFYVNATLAIAVGYLSILLILEGDYLSAFFTLVATSLFIYLAYTCDEPEDYDDRYK